MRFFNLSNAKQDSLKVYEEYAQWVAEELKVDKVLHDTIVVVVNKHDNKNTAGSILDYHIAGDPYFSKRYSIHLSYDHLKGFLAYNTIAHEFTHLQQIHRGSLIAHLPLKRVWNEYDFIIAEHTSYYKYLKLPWEIEARRVARKLMFKYAWIKIKGKFIR